jgi:hypothetical protein
MSLCRNSRPPGQAAIAVKSPPTRFHTPPGTDPGLVRDVPSPTPEQRDVVVAVVQGQVEVAVTVQSSTWTFQGRPPRTSRQMHVIVGPERALKRAVAWRGAQRPSSRRG